MTQAQRSAPITPRERDTIIGALAAGEVPQIGMGHLGAGYQSELAVAATDIERVAGNGTMLRLILGEVGAGKAFFLHKMRQLALDRRLVAVHGQVAGATAEEFRTDLIASLATRSRPGGGALGAIIERFLGEVAKAAEVSGGTVEAQIEKRLTGFPDVAGGTAFITVLKAYWQAFEAGEMAPRQAALDWFSADTEVGEAAGEALGAAPLASVASFHEQLRLLSGFVRRAGYKGLLVICSEMAPSEAGFEDEADAFDTARQLISDALGAADLGLGEGLGFAFAGSPDLLEELRRGLPGDAPLFMHLSRATFGNTETAEAPRPIIRLGGLSRADVITMLKNIRTVIAGEDAKNHPISDEDLPRFLEFCGADNGEGKRTRYALKIFVRLLIVLEEYPDNDWQSLMKHVVMADADAGADAGVDAGVDAGADAGEAEAETEPGPTEDETGA